MNMKNRLFPNDLRIEDTSSSPSQPTNPSLPPLSIPRANRIGFIGDSNTHNTGRDNIEIMKPVWPAIMGIMSNMRAYIGLNAAVSGYTTKTALDIQVAKVIADNPSKCIVMIGTNDIGLKGTGINFPNDSKSNIAQIADRLVAANIEPIFMTVYPITQGSVLGGNVVEDVHNKVNLFNQFLKSFCLKRGYQCYDTYGLLVEPSTGNMNPTSPDGVHTGTFLSHWVAEYVVQRLASKLPAWNPQLCESNSDPTTLLTNPLFITDTNTDGIPDGWTKNGTSFTTRIDPGVAVHGKWATFFANSYQASGTSLSQTITSGFSSGDKIAIGGKIKAKVGNKDGSKYSCKITFNGASTDLYSPMYEFLCSIEGTFYQEYTVPSNTTSITVDIGVASGIGTFQFGQMTVRNLTALGAI
ncbi:SGNH/GDSL hydrolase family protein [Paenibacillus sp. JSM ZJ436]|uniref:SGNH/GDSL hydrolase family protein n=1 Tax=Paenibacillus sp. JSM ZJ436 TaxID=3376190 RepID=UPI0037A128F6